MINNIKIIPNNENNVNKVNKDFYERAIHNTREYK